MQKVFVGLSGGVDSSVAAYLLKRRGFAVTGVFIKAWHPDSFPCNWREEMHDAMRICAKLEIPFLLCDLESEYKREVIDYLINEYRAGRTPNPDVMCNKEIKFGAFLDFSLRNGADYIATGHYAQNLEKDGRYHLINAEDNDKDQTYFLWNLTQDILRRVLFPIGHLNKSEVRKIANQARLFTATKKDSQGLCFIGHISIKDFLKKFTKVVPGDVLNPNGEIIGRHDGAILYTIGERHGFEIFHKENLSLPLYIVKKNLKDNTVIVSDILEKSAVKTVKLHKTNLIQEHILDKKELWVKTRYRQENQKCSVLNNNKETLELEFESPQNFLASGQSAVLYSNQECLGGGVIV
ncbi:MAG TPA: tRNA 2-thiouridine(34) synthase MnmA [Candidatus Paceibacterota bacterium]|nr:tRNA 2-thiouridine(34) synthase MnmA [Candidatus Paceibacterota bacterium]HRZ34534.1 tRNA 2-thiouridine(34) synthase MnmA [Candidatus Paceibacterota bacterium]